jgi:mannosyl-oligosaccharide alpha-1,2-mannosidase
MVAVRFKFVVLVIITLIFLLFLKRSRREYTYIVPHTETTSGSPEKGQNAFNWATVSQDYPVTTFRKVPKPKSRTIPKLQAKFGKESKKEVEVRKHRLEAVKGQFTHAWTGYKEHAWLKDEVAPRSGTALNPFGGWAATLVDSLGMALSKVIILVRTNMSHRHVMDHGYEV